MALCKQRRLVNVSGKWISFCLGDSPASLGSSWTLLGDQVEEEVRSVSDASSQSAKCFLPNTALPSAAGHLLRVENLKPGDKVRLRDGAEASVVDVKRHPSDKTPCEVVELSTHQGKFRMSNSHRVAVPGTGGARGRLSLEVQLCSCQIFYLASKVMGRFWGAWPESSKTLHGPA